MTDFSMLSSLGKIEQDVPLAQRTTLGVGGVAAWLFRPKSQSDLMQALHLIPQDLPIFPMGRGSNLLIADDGIDALVLDLGDFNTLEVNHHTLLAGAGARMSKIAQRAALSGFSGLEFMATVPGDLGGGVAMNAGAFGQQVSDTLVSILLLNRDGQLQHINRQDLNMQYRYTALPQGSVVLSATFELGEKGAEEVKQVMREMRAKRSQTQPLNLPNCGSVFKNPEGDFAARLIESVGLKGKQIGKANISDVHANFIVNQGGASCADVLGLIRLAKDTVKQEMNVELEPEVKLVGCAL
ncbi:MAG: UDP-N-acetylmuramate dehydrogenase [Ghiorsea sp.]|nr:UDP-N-acetylmuramate dehydrogenase [Ghiorsea sp.]